MGYKNFSNRRKPLFTFNFDIHSVFCDLQKEEKIINVNHTVIDVDTLDLPTYGPPYLEQE